MSAIDNTPLNRNFLSPLNFKFSIKRSPNLNFFIQKAIIPSISLGHIEVPSPFIPIPQQRTSMEYGDLTVQFKVDEDFQNYIEIHSWMRSLGFPDNYTEHANISANPVQTGLGIVSDLSLIILNSTKNPNYEFSFRSAWPTYLSEIDFDTTANDVDYVTASATFKYLIMDITKIT